MRTNQTTFQRAIAQARKLLPGVRQINNSLMFDCASTSHLDGFHHVYLGPNKYNPFIDATCDCGTPKHFCCVHKAATFLQYTSNLEARCEKGYEYLHSSGITPEEYAAAEDLFVNLLDKFTRCLDLIRAIEEGFDINTLTKPFRDRLNPLTDQLLLTA